MAILVQTNFDLQERVLKLKKVAREKNSDDQLEYSKKGFYTWQKHVKKETYRTWLDNLNR